MGNLNWRGYVETRLVIPGVHWMGGMLDLLHRHRMYFSNDVLIESCVLSVMNRERQTFDEAM